MHQRDIYTTAFSPLLQLNISEWLRENVFVKNVKHNHSKTQVVETVYSKQKNI
jgi:hypothetical protein